MVRKTEGEYLRRIANRRIRIAALEAALAVLDPAVQRQEYRHIRLMVSKSRSKIRLYEYLIEFWKECDQWK